MKGKLLLKKKRISSTKNRPMYSLKKEKKNSVQAEKKPRNLEHLRLENPFASMPATV